MRVVQSIGGGLYFLTLRLCGDSGTNVGALIIRIGLWGKLYHSYKKEPPLPPPPAKKKNW